MGFRRTDLEVPAPVGETTTIIGEPCSVCRVGVPASVEDVCAAGDGRMETTVRDAIATNTAAGATTPTTNAAVIAGEGLGRDRAIARMMLALWTPARLATPNVTWWRPRCHPVDVGGARTTTPPPADHRPHGREPAAWWLDGYTESVGNEVDTQP